MFSRLKLSALHQQESPGHPELLGQLIDAHTGPHALYGHALKLPGISLSSLHSRFLSRRVCPSRVCHFKGSFHFEREIETTSAVKRVAEQWLAAPAVLFQVIENTLGVRRRHRYCVSRCVSTPAFRVVRRGTTQQPPMGHTFS